MSENNPQAAQGRTEARDFKEHAALQTQLLRLNAQLRDFERLTRSGVLTVAYRELEAQRDQTLKKLRDRTPKPTVRAGEVALGPPPLGSLLTAPVSAAKITIGSSPWLGYAGVVQAGPAQQLYDNTPSNDGFDDYAGSIFTYRLDYAGGVYFGGYLDAGEGKQPGDSYEWNHSWRYLIPFPPATATSLFTCAFDVNAQCAIGSAFGNPYLAVHVFLSETADYQGYALSYQKYLGSLIDTFVEPGTNSTLQGRVAVRRSFAVQAGRFPAISMALLVACELQPKDSLHFIDMNESYIVPGSALRPEGTIEFRYDPVIQAQS